MKEPKVLGYGQQAHFPFRKIQMNSSQMLCYTVLLQKSFKTTAIRGHIFLWISQHLHHYPVKEKRDTAMRVINPQILQILLDSWKWKCFKAVLFSSLQTKLALKKECTSVHLCSSDAHLYISCILL